VLDTATNIVTGTIAFPPTSIAFSPDGSVAYAESDPVSNSGLAVIDTATLALTAYITGINPLRGPGETVLATPDGRYVYAGGAPGAIIDAQTMAIVAPFESGGSVVLF
jgi:DNA-binding beta-propeller fold protein YncE